METVPHELLTRVHSLGVLEDETPPTFTVPTFIKTFVAVACLFTHKYNSVLPSTPLFKLALLLC